ncbi:glycoside hydrolase family 9 protein [Fibrobacter sp.]|uniref:glycoside hydrolase family 9 protein n=1 Tax=Fibrobacter sp. TaxID=35828 RepID=UPI00388DD7A3
MVNCKHLFATLLTFGMAAECFAALSVDDYVEAAWMTTRFYGAQRSGQGPNWILQETNHPTSFTKDNYNGKDVSGGWFDCGDHVMYGQSQGYASYVLALAYAEFTEGFYDLYTGDYSDYKSSKDYSSKGGKPNQVRDLLEELRYEADFWVKAAISSSNFVTVKGDGNADHQKWVTAGMMSTLGSGEGGEPRYVKGDADDAYTPGMAAAMLAVMARVDPIQENKTKYLNAAKTAYSYSKSHKGVTNSSGFYESSWWQDRWQDGPFLAAMELYRTTKEETYKSEASTWFQKINFEQGNGTPFAYSNAIPLSVLMGEFVLDLEPERGSQKTTSAYLNYVFKRKRDAEEKYFSLSTDQNFPVRTPSGGAFLYGLYAKFKGDSVSYALADTLVEQNINFLLGDNKNKKSYVVGYTRNGAKAPDRPHHRGYYGNEDPGREISGAPQPPERNKYLGGMIAGNFKSGSHDGNQSNWQVNEVCVDMNAPLVGALGYILSRKAPKTNSDLGIPEEKKDEPKDTVSTDTLSRDTLAADTSKKDSSDAIHAMATASSLKLFQQGSKITLMNGCSAFKVQVFDLKGNMVQHFSSENGMLSFDLKGKGVMQIRVTSNGYRKVFKVKSL